MLEILDIIAHRPNNSPWGIKTWNSMEFHGKNNRKGCSMEIAPWSSCIEFYGKLSMELYGLIKFHGGPWNTISMYFHGI